MVMWMGNRGCRAPKYIGKMMGRKPEDEKQCFAMKISGI